MSGLRYSDTGDDTKPAVVLLHGFLGCKEDWQEVIAGLQEDFRCVAIDLPGHGESAAVDDALFPMDNCAAAVMEVLDELGVSSCHIVGYSMGGRLAIYLVVSYPDRFTCAVIESASPGLRTAAERSARRAQDEALAERLQTISVEEFVAEWYGRPLFESLRRFDDRLAELQKRRSAIAPVGVAKSLRFMGTGAQPSLWQRLAGIKIQVLFLAGELDRKFSLLAAQMAAATPQGQAEVFGDCGHILHFEQPELYIRRVRIYLKSFVAL